MQGERQEESQKITAHIGMTVRFVIHIFIILLLSQGMSFGLMVGLHRLGLLAFGMGFSLWGPLMLFGMSSVIMGSLFSWVFSRRILAPFQKLIAAIDELAEGNFDVRLNLGGTRKTREVSESFNHMAEELGSLELLRSDFVNNFSHEFKTPIASIRGFAKMLQREELSEQERREYLEIIASESGRLTELSNNVLNLSRIENQTILTNQSVFNCTEQIRRMIALLEPKWSKKKQQFFFEGDEIKICGNMELLEQVWINLLDNAIKFSGEGTVISLLLRKRPGCVLFTVTDRGPGISDKAREHVFDKFYQGDSSHGTRGNGLGLAITKKIVDLHKGSIRIVKTDASGTVFEVMLPSGMVMETGIL